MPTLYGRYKLHACATNWRKEMRLCAFLSCPHTRDFRRCSASADSLGRSHLDRTIPEHHSVVCLIASGCSSDYDQKHPKALPKYNVYLKTNILYVHRRMLQFPSVTAGCSLQTFVWIPNLWRAACRIYGELHVKSLHSRTKRQPQMHIVISTELLVQRPADTVASRLHPLSNTSWA